MSKDAYIQALVCALKNIGGQDCKISDEVTEDCTKEIIDLKVSDHLMLKIMAGIANDGLESMIFDCELALRLTDRPKVARWLIQRLVNEENHTALKRSREVKNFPQWKKDLFPLEIDENSDEKIKVKTSDERFESLEHWDEMSNEVKLYTNAIFKPKMCAPFIVKNSKNVEKIEKAIIKKTSGHVRRDLKKAIEPLKELTEEELESHQYDIIQKMAGIVIQEWSVADTLNLVGPSAKTKLRKVIMADKNISASLLMMTGLRFIKRGKALKIIENNGKKPQEEESSESESEDDKKPVKKDRKKKAKESESEEESDSESDEEPVKKKKAKKESSDEENDDSDDSEDSEDSEDEI